MILEPETAVGLLTVPPDVAAMLGIPVDVNDVDMHYVAPWRTAEQNEELHGEHIATAIIVQHCHGHGDEVVDHYYLAADLEHIIPGSDGLPLPLFGAVRPFNPEEETEIPDGVDF